MKTLLLLLSLTINLSSQAAAELTLHPKSEVTTPGLRYYQKLYKNNLPPELEEEFNAQALEHLENCYALVGKLKINATQLSKSEADTYQRFLQEDLLAELQRLCLDNVVRSEDF